VRAIGFHALGHCNHIDRPVFLKQVVGRLGVFAQIGAEVSRLDLAEYLGGIVSSDTKA
jgi:hypothetical protein